MHSRITFEEAVQLPLFGVTDSDSEQVEEIEHGVHVSRLQLAEEINGKGEYFYLFEGEVRPIALRIHREITAIEVEGSHDHTETGKPFLEAFDYIAETCLVFQGVV